MENNTSYTWLKLLMERREEHGEPRIVPHHYYRTLDGSFVYSLEYAFDDDHMHRPKKKESPLESIFGRAVATMERPEKKPSIGMYFLMLKTKNKQVPVAGSYQTDVEGFMPVEYGLSILYEVTVEVTGFYPPQEVEPPEYYI